MTNEEHIYQLVLANDAIVAENREYDKMNKYLSYERDKYKAQRDALIDAVQMAVVAIDDKQYPAVHGELIAALNKIKEG
jgi:hypothetical protein